MITYFHVAVVLVIAFVMGTIAWIASSNILITILVGSITLWLIASIIQKRYSR